MIVHSYVSMPEGYQTVKSTLNGVGQSGIFVQRLHLICLRPKSIFMDNGSTWFQEPMVYGIRHPIIYQIPIINHGLWILVVDKSWDNHDSNGMITSTMGWWLQGQLTAAAPGESPNGAASVRAAVEPQGVSVGGVWVPLGSRAAIQRWWRVNLLNLLGIEYFSEGLKPEVLGLSKS